MTAGQQAERVWPVVTLERDVVLTRSDEVRFSGHLHCDPLSAAEVGDY